MATASSKIPAKYSRGPVHVDVERAPFRIGQAVRVHKIFDDAGDCTFLGKSGIIEHYEYSCGCCQSYPSDPMLGVRLPDGRLEEFWKEELRTIRMSRGARPRKLTHRRCLRSRGGSLIRTNRGEATPNPFNHLPPSTAGFSRLTPVS